MMNGNLGALWKVRGGGGDRENREKGQKRYGNLAKNSPEGGK